MNYLFYPVLLLNIYCLYISKKIQYDRIYAIEKRLDNLEDATWGQKTTFTITELQGK